jgi:transposase
MQGAMYSTYEIRLRAVEAVTDGMKIKDVAKAYRTNRITVYRWCKRFKSNGRQGLQRQLVSGRPRLLRGVDKEQLVSIVLEPASKFGYETDFWTCGRLCAVIEEQFHENLSIWTMWRRLREIGLTYQKPERRYFEVSEEKREEWRQKELPRIRRTVRRYHAILYCQDESNISLTAFLGKTWALRGQTPIQEVTGKRGGIAAMSAIAGGGRLIFRLHEKRIKSDEVIDFLGQMLKHHKRRHLVVVMDQAKPHTSKKTRSFVDSQDRLHVFHLPAHSPDWNPDEQVWNHLKHQELKGHRARTKEQMKNLAEQKLTDMANNPRQLRGIFFRCCVAELLQ